LHINYSINDGSNWISPSLLYVVTVYWFYVASFALHFSTNIGYAQERMQTSNFWVSRTDRL